MPDAEAGRRRGEESNKNIVGEDQATSAGNCRTGHRKTQLLMFSLASSAARMVVRALVPEMNDEID